MPEKASRLFSSSELSFLIASRVGVKNYSLSRVLAGNISNIYEPLVEIWHSLKLGFHDDRFPPVTQAIHQTIAGHFGRHPVKKELIGGREQNTHRRYRSCWLKIV